MANNPFNLTWQSVERFAGCLRARLEKPDLPGDIIEHVMRFYHENPSERASIYFVTSEVKKSSGA